MVGSLFLLTAVARTRGASVLRGLPLMTSAKFLDFLTPSPPCPQIHATSLTELPYFVCFSTNPPSPPWRGRHKWKPPNGTAAPRNISHELQERVKDCCHSSRRIHRTMGLSNCQFSRFPFSRSSEKKKSLVSMSIAVKCRCLVFFTKVDTFV